MTRRITIGGLRNASLVGGNSNNLLKLYYGDKTVEDGADNDLLGINGIVNGKDLIDSGDRFNALTAKTLAVNFTNCTTEDRSTIEISRVDLEDVVENGTDEKRYRLKRFFCKELARQDQRLDGNDTTRSMNDSAKVG
ncbi:MAG: hypothetical protein AAF922_04465 [Pseudomonadota bacterium]